MAKKTKKKEIFEGTYELLGEKRNPDIDKLVKLYKEDRYKARVVYMNGDREHYQSHRLALFTKPNGDFNIVYFKKTFGINKINVMYSSERRETNIVYKRGKFHKVVSRGSNKYIQQLTFNNLTMDLHWGVSDIVKQFFIKKFTWLRHMDEKSVLKDMAFNSIVDKKLFSLKKALTYQYQTPYPVAKILHSMSHNRDRTKFIKTYLPYIKNIENFNDEWVSNELFSLFYDSIKMARVLNKEVNCSWSNKRLKNEHDKWSEQIADIIFTHDNREMNVGQIYKDFQEFSQYPLLTTTKEMAIEGKKQNHCVASYVSSVDNHGCGIYKVDEYTLELRKSYSNGYMLLKLGQLRGWDNKNAPPEMHELVKEHLNSFNKGIAKDDYDECEKYLQDQGDIMPF